MTSTPDSRGFALVTSLIILAMLALLGAAAMTATNTELRVAGDSEDRARSFEAAEAGLNAALTIVATDLARLPLSGGSLDIDFTSLGDQNPLQHLLSDAAGAGSNNSDNDMPVVTATISGDPKGKCARSADASSDDLLGCSAFALTSTHHKGTEDDPRGHFSTTVQMGVTTQRIKD